MPGAFLVNPRPRVLFVSRRFLLPADTGGKIRTSKILEQLRDRWDVTLIGHFHAATQAQHLHNLRSLCAEFVPVPLDQEPPIGRLSRLGRRLARLLSRYPLHVLYETSPNLRAAIRALLKKEAFDLLIVDFVQSCQNIPSQLPCASLLFTHNVEARILRRQAQTAASWHKLVFWMMQARRMARFEREQAARFERVIAVSDSDREEFERYYGLTNVRTIPTGVDAEYFSPQSTAVDTDEIVFCGSMDWIPNQEAVEWFVSSILPRIQKTLPNARLTVVGRKAPPDLVARVGQPKAVHFTNWVADVRPYLARAGCVVVPLRVGGGTRIKIFEALAMNKAVVSTTIGAEGLDIEAGHHYLSADSAVDFAAAVLRCLQHSDEALELGRRGGNHVRANFGWPRVAGRFIEIGNEAIDTHRRPIE
ncbi:MAG: glycosyltransferase family 4 protein [Vicinamibacteria bacterium]|nr:glycosyltransferase family 4 protein [Vicinamibacteria bacterium]